MIRLFEKLWSHGQVPLRGLQIDMAEIRGQRREEALYVGILPVSLGHPMHCKRVPQVMNAWLKGRFIVAFNPREPSQASEALIDHSQSDGISALCLEQRPIVLILSRGQFEILPDQLVDVSTKGHET